MGKAKMLTIALIRSGALVYREDLAVRNNGAHYLLIYFYLLLINIYLFLFTIFLYVIPKYQ
jgi:ABC-type Na+ efflux pump permease subunit